MNVKSFFKKTLFSTFLVYCLSSAASAQTVDLTITMTGPASVRNGDLATYELSIVNGGPSDADGATFSDIIPSGFAVTGATCSTVTNGGVCPTTINISGQTVSGTIPTLPNAGSVVIQIATRAPVRPTVSSYTNTATVAAPTGREETNATTNTAVVNTTVSVQAADLSATASASQSSYAFGDLQSFTFDFINNGPGPADGAQVTGGHSSTRTGGVTSAKYTDLTVNCSASGGAVCPNVAPPASGDFYSTSNYFSNATVPTWPSGGSLQFTVSYKITDFVGPATGCGDTNRTYNTSVRGSASIGSFITDPVSSNNNSASFAMTGPDLTQNACPGADLATTVTVDNTNLTFGSPSTYTVVHTNLGPGAADGSSIRFRSIASVREGNVSSFNYVGARIVSCTAIGGAVCPAITAAETNTILGGWRDLYTGTVATWPSGGSLTVVYEMTPRDYTLSSSCGPAPLSYANLSVSAFASVASGTVDPVSTNNAQDLYPINGPQQVLPDCPNADIGVTNSMSTQDLVFGNPIEFTTVWTNNGPDLASGVIIKSRIGRSGISGGIIGFNYSDLAILECTATGGVVCPTPTPSSTGEVYISSDLISATIGDWPSGATISIRYKLTPNSYVYSSCSGIARGALFNTGFFTLPSGLTDPVSANNSANVTTNQGPLCMDGSITASLAPAAPYPNGPVALTIEQSIPANATTATNWEILDILPAGFVFDGVDASCTVISGNATCGSFSWNPTTRVFSSVTPTAEVGSVLRWIINGQAIGYSSTWTNSVNLVPAPTYIDPRETSNIATVNLNITGTDPKLTKQAVDRQILAGDLVTYRLTVSNPSNGNQLDSFVLTDQLPAGWVYDSTTTVTMTGGTTRSNGADPSNGDVSPQWTGFTVPPGGTIFIEFEARSPSSLTCGATNYDNSATISYVTSGLSDTRIYNGVLIGNDNDNVAVPCSPELTKSYNTPTITSGNNAELTFRISPVTPGIAYPFAMNFSDTLPSSLQIVGLKSGSNSCGGSITDLDGSSIGAGDTGVKLTGGLLQASGTQACSFTVLVTNKPRLTNAECTSAPANFTNGASNISDLVNLSNAVTNQCLRVLPTTGTLRITKALSLPSGITGPFTFGFSAVCDLPSAGTVYGPVALTNFPTTRTVDITGIPEGASCSVQETTPTPPSGYVWAPPSVGAMTPSTGIPANAVQTVTVTNALSNPVYAVKSVLSQPARLAADANQFDITYRVTVYNDGITNGTYDLSDTLGLDADVSVVGAPVVTASTNVTTAVNALWGGTAEQSALVTSEPIAAGENETFDISLRLSIDTNATSNDACTGSTGRGLYNAASLTTGGLTSSVSVCAATPSALPVVNAGQTFSYEEMRTEGQTVGTVTVTNFATANVWQFADSARAVSTDGFYQIGNDGGITLTAAGVAAGVAQNDYETGNNDFVYAVQAGTGSGWSSPVDVTLMVTDIDEDAPGIVGPDGANGTTSGATGSVYVAEGENSVVTYTASDASTITWSISGGDDAGRFSLNPSTGVLSFNITTDYEAPVDTDRNNDYVVVIRVTDQVGNYAEQTLTVFITDVWDSLPGTVNRTDLDGDSLADSLESASADRDGDGVADARDYDPQGYLYCEDDGRILTGGRISVSGPNGSNNAVGVLNSIRIVKDGSDGEYQWFATAPGTYTMSVTYPTSVGVPSTTRVSSGTLDMTNLLPNNPASIGSSEFGTEGFLSNYWNGGSDPNVAANTTTAFYTTFEIEAGDPNVIGNNFPVAQCGVNKVSIARVSDGAEASGDTTSPLIYTISQTRVSTQNTIIAYRVAGSSQATAGVDFAAVSGVATITAGQTSTQITVAVLEDVLIEGDEAVVLELTGITAGDLTTALTDVAGGLSASALIVDDDFTDVVINEIDLTTTEGRDTDPAIVGLSLAGQPAAPVVMSITVDAQCTVSPSTLTFTADDFATEQRLTIRAVNDDLVEGTHSCQPIVSISSTDLRYHGFVVTMPQITIADDLVDQIRTPLKNVLQSDFTNTVSAQSRAMSGISRGALGRLHEGANEEECQTFTPMAFDGTTTANEDDASSAWSFDQDNVNCITGERTITDGSFTLSKSDGSDEQGLFSMTVQRETQQGTSSLSGVFAGGYASRTSLTDIGTGAVDGVGVMGGIYGARSVQDGLFVDYYAGGSTGVHRYDLSFYAPSAAIWADGDYSYRAIFAGAALSGEMTHEKMQIRPRLGFDIGRATASDASVSARQLGQTDTGRIRLDAVAGARGYAEAVFSFGTRLNDESSEDAPHPIRKFEFAPRVFCEQSFGMSDTSCGGGASIRFTNSNPVTGSDLDVTLDLEGTGDVQRSRIGLSYTEQILGGAGSAVSTLGTDAMGNAQIGQSVEIKF